MAVYGNLCPACVATPGKRQAAVKGNISVRGVGLPCTLNLSGIIAMGIVEWEGKHWDGIIGLGRLEYHPVWGGVPAERLRKGQQIIPLSLASNERARGGCREVPGMLAGSAPERRHRGELAKVPENAVPGRSRTPFPTTLSYVYELIVESAPRAPESGRCRDVPENARRKRPGGRPFLDGTAASRKCRRRRTRTAESGRCRELTPL
eukprot:gene19586-biopygen19052